MKDFYPVGFGHGEFVQYSRYHDIINIRIFILDGGSSYDTYDI